MRYKSDTITFYWHGDYHNVLYQEDYTGEYPCQDGLTLPENHSLHTDFYNYQNFTFEKNTTYYFYCNKPNHCENGMWKVVTVLPRARQSTFNWTTDLGTYNDPYAQMKKKQCKMKEEYQDEVGQTKCKTLSECDAGHFVSNFPMSHKEGSSENRVCKRCTVSQYSTSKNQENCLPCKTGTRSDLTRTRCMQDDDDNDFPDWYWGFIAPILLIVVVGLSVVIIQERRRAKEVELNKKQQVGHVTNSLIF